MDRRNRKKDEGKGKVEVFLKESGIQFQFNHVL